MWGGWNGWPHEQQLDCATRELAADDARRYDLGVVQHDDGARSQQVRQIAEARVRKAILAIAVEHHQP